MSTDFVITLGQNAIWTMLKVAGPLLGIGLLVGLVVSIFQATASVHPEAHCDLRRDDRVRPVDALADSGLYPRNPRQPQYVYRLEGKTSMLNLVLNYAEVFTLVLIRMSGFFFMNEYTTHFIFDWHLDPCTVKPSPLPLLFHTFLFTFYHISGRSWIRTNTVTAST